MALAAASSRRVLRAPARTIRTTIEGRIAALCILGENSLIRNDRDFDCPSAPRGAPLLVHGEEVVGLSVLRP